jgi:hypothetical protein
MAKADTVVDDLRKLTAEEGLSKVMRLLGKLNEADRGRVVRAMVELFRDDIPYNPVRS